MNHHSKSLKAKKNLIGTGILIIFLLTGAWYFYQSNFGLSKNCEEFLVKFPFIKDESGACKDKWSIALNKKDPTLCGEDRSCYAYLGFADKYICSEIKDDNLHDDCTIAAALYENNANICLDVKAEIIQGRCFADTLDNWKKCSNVEKALARDVCYFTKSASALSGEACKKVTDEKQRNKCLDFIARNTTNPALCDEIKDAELKTNCKKASAYKIEFLPADKDKVIIK